MTLNEAVSGRKYIISVIETEDSELNEFLFSLGCYSGEGITLISQTKSGCIIAVKGARYNIDTELAAAIILKGD